MKNNYIAAKDFYYILPAALFLGAALTSVQEGNWLIGFASFSFLSLLSFSLLTLSLRWTNGGRILWLITFLAFFLRLGVGTALHLALPVYGHEDEDDRAGYVSTDAHRRDDQAWSLATSDLPVIDAFSQKYGSDQYGGLLAFNTLIYRYFSPDAQRPLMLILLSAFFAVLGIPFFWKAVGQVFGEKVAWVAAWIFALYPDSILLGASAMREPYLLTFNALAFWGFVARFQRVDGDRALKRSGEVFNFSKNPSGWAWMALGLLGMLLVSPAIALATIIIFTGWIFFTNESRELSWKGIAAIAMIFVLALLFLSASLNRSGEFGGSSPLHVINDWLQLAVRWDVYQLERDSGWVQKIFDQAPQWVRLPFVAVYGIFQPVLPAALIYPTVPLWKLIIIPRAIAWYALLPALVLSFVAAASQPSRQRRTLVLWLTLITWIWILLAALRGGADLWDNPRYRTILFVWQAILAGNVWVWWRETRNAWATRLVLMEVVFLLFFTEWYANRYFHWGIRFNEYLMVALILGLWGVILGVGFWRDRRGGSEDKQSSPADKQGGPVDKQGGPADKSRA